jgi:hypothetical protein
VLFVSRGDSSEVFEFIEKALNDIAMPVEKSAGDASGVRAMSKENMVSAPAIAPLDERSHEDISSPWV